MMTALHQLLSLLTLLSVIGHMTQAEKTAFLVVDIQNCFLPGGTLAVNDGNDVINVINNIRKMYNFDLVITSRDWHCSEHVSFASQHVGKNILDIVSLDYDSKGNLCRRRSGGPSRDDTVDCSQVAHQLNQTLWPDHCIMETQDAQLSTSLVTSPSDVVINKGYRCNIDSYSVFYDNGGFAQTELQQTLQSAEITSVIIAGLARDYCVLFTAKDAHRLGYKTTVVLDATRPVAEATGKMAVDEMEKLDITLINSTDLVVTAGAANCRESGILYISLLAMCHLIKDFL